MEFVGREVMDPQLHGSKATLSSTEVGKQVLKMNAATHCPLPKTFCETY